MPGRNRSKCALLAHKGSSAIMPPGTTLQCRSAPGSPGASPPGPTTLEGKAKVTRNAYKGGDWLMLRNLSKACWPRVMELTLNPVWRMLLPLLQIDQRVPAMTPQKPPSKTPSPQAMRIAAQILANKAKRQAQVKAKAKG